MQEDYHQSKNHKNLTKKLDEINWKMDESSFNIITSGKTGRTTSFFVHGQSNDIIDSITEHAMRSEPIRDIIIRSAKKIMSKLN